MIDQKLGKRAALILMMSAIIFNLNAQHTHAEFLTNHHFAVGQTELLLTDSLRNRPITTTIWYPTVDTLRENRSAVYPFKLPPTAYDAEIKASQYALVVMSHGTGGNRNSLMWLACELAGKGYIVAAMDHYGNTFDNKIPVNFLKIWDRSLDVSFVIDHLTQDTSWRKLIDQSKISMIGFSLGGFTAFALAGGEVDYQQLWNYAKTKKGKREFRTPEIGDVSKFFTEEILLEGKSHYGLLQEDRIDSFIALAPVLGQGFNPPNSLGGIEKPILIVGAKFDKRAVIKQNAGHYHRSIDHSQYMEVAAGHYVFLNEAKEELSKNVPQLYKDKKGIDRRAIHDQLTIAILRFLKNKN